MRDILKKISRMIVGITLSLPYTGVTAIKRDYFQPIFQFEYQSQDAYVINQKYFASRDVLPSEFYKNNEIFKAVDQIRPKNSISYEDMLKFMPTTLAPTTDERFVTQALIDRAFRMFITSENSKNLTVVKAIDRIEKVMNTEVDLGKSKDGIENKLTMNYDLATRTTKLALSGNIEGNASFSGTNSETIVSLTKKIPSGIVGISHYENSMESKDLVTLSYNF
ncbi:MAG: hypothetical protein A4S09_00285 [Proteobacteria bacterium SG_bin7]|nr:MAG: hypothetical protein A4S09_00285 [Proteobacteria bacterium SG_bin7]